MRTSSNRMCLALLVCLAVLLAAPAAQPMPQEQSEELKIVIAAEPLMNEGKFDEVIAEVQKAIEINENFWQAYWLGGHAYQAKKEYDKAFEYFTKVTELNPGFGLGYRSVSFNAAAMGDMETAWVQAIKAHQAGTDMSDAFNGMPPAEAPDDLDIQLAAYRVFVGPFDTTVFQEQGDTALQGGANSSATGRTDVGKRVVQEATLEIRNYLQTARKRFSDSRAFGLVQRQDMAQLIFVTEVDYLQDNMSRRRMRGYAKLVDAQSGEELFRRRIEFANIVSTGDLNRDFSQLMNFMEEWAAEQQR